MKTCMTCGTSKEHKTCKDCKTCRNVVGFGDSEGQTNYRCEPCWHALFRASLKGVKTFEYPGQGKPRSYPNE